MRHPVYIKLVNPRVVKFANDPESPTVNAPVMKIVQYIGPDELHDHAHVQIAFTYGYINSQDKFIALDSQVHIDVLADIGEDGINPITKYKEKPGNWYSDMMIPANHQRSRVQGDFRQIDLYEYLMKKYDIEGEIVGYSHHEKR